MPNPNSLSLSELQRLIYHRQRELKRLTKQREKIERKLDAVNEKIAALGGNGAVSGSSRPRNDISLDEAIAQVLTKASKPLKVGDIMEKVTKLGYRSSSANFRGIVNQTLIKDKRFKAASRGVYGMKS